MLEALAVFYWYKRDLERFLRSALADHPEVLSRISFEASSKRQVAVEVVTQLQTNESRYQETALDLLERLADYPDAFDGLARTEDGPSKVKVAQAALRAVQAVTSQNRDLLNARDETLRRIQDDLEQSATRRTHEAVLAELNAEFMVLHSQKTDPQGRGIEFERLLERLFALHDLDPRAAYNIDHEQVDGAFTFRTDDYLMEAKWWKVPVDPRELNPFRATVESKAANTLGLCISISGFTEGALLKRTERSPLILMDGADLVAILENRISLAEVLERKRRHAVETDNPFYSVREMHG